MPRLICLYIEDNDKADELLDTIKEAGVVRTEFGFHDEFGEVAVVPVAMFAVPTLYCECPKEDKMRVTRGAKMGWWIHNKEGCYKPIAQQWQSPKNLIAKDPRLEGVHVNWTWQAPLPHLLSLHENSSGMPNTSG